jgi:hypothetical protein
LFSTGVFSTGVSLFSTGVSLFSTGVVSSFSTGVFSTGVFSTGVSTGVSTGEVVSELISEVFSVDVGAGSSNLSDVYTFLTFLESSGHFSSAILFKSSTVFPL